MRYSSEKQKINDLRHRATETWSWVVYWQSAAQEDAVRQSTDNNIVLVSSRQGHPNVVVRRCYNVEKTEQRAEEEKKKTQEALNLTGCGSNGSLFPM